MTNSSSIKQTYLITGGAGFIGSNFVRMARREGWARIINLDKLTYAGNISSLDSLRSDGNHIFIQGDIADGVLLREIFKKYRPDALINFAAESHVDRSIDHPTEFVQTNVIGTFNLLDEARRYWNKLPPDRMELFRFLHISTDEVYGSLGLEDRPFAESHPYAPNSPYSASKAASDHFVRAYHHTYGLPVLTTNCSNNYGPHQFPEKLIPLMIFNAIKGKPLPVYGDGKNIRDWLYVGDHCMAIEMVLRKGRAGETYNIGGRCEMSNIDLVHQICEILDDLKPSRDGLTYKDLITFVDDRPGHDRRYAIDDTKIFKELGWKPKESFETGLRKTVRWYLENETWTNSVREKQS